MQREFVQKAKIYGFAAFLQWAVLEYDELMKSANYPTQEELTRLNMRMRHSMTSIRMEYVYLEPPHPLQIEQQVALLIHPRVSELTSNFDQWLQNYDTTTMTEPKQEELLDYLYRGQKIIDQWNLLSRSFNAKLEGLSDEILKQREDALIDMIEHMSPGLT